MAQEPTTASLRKVLDRVLVSDSDLDAFCLDYFPKVKRRFTDGMDRIAKVTRLLEHAPAAVILDHLRDRHTATLAECEDLLRYQDVAPTDPAPPDMQQAPASGLAPGQHIGKYRIEQKLGQGGMGAVFTALHEGTGGQVAIKILLPQFSRDPQVMARFFNEARATNRVNHPGIVRIFDCDRLDTGAAYIVMELLSGESLRARLDSAAMPLPAALRLGGQIASVLATVHDKGIVHRDLKPDNVMVVPDPHVIGRERAKVLDFGIAKMAEEHFGSLAKGQAAATQADIAMGTPLYMAPEQCQDAATVTAKADVYSLGVILYQMLAGTPPFQSNNFRQILVMHITQVPRPLAQAAPGAPPALCALVHRMLAKEPAGRPTMAEVEQELVTLQDPVVRRRGLLPVLVGVVLAVLGVGGTGMLLHSCGRTSGPTAAPDMGRDLGKGRMPVLDLEAEPPHKLRALEP